MPAPSQHNSDRVTSEILHNKNCFYYLKKIKLPENEPNPIKNCLGETLFNQIKNVQNPEEQYNQMFSYADLYKQLFNREDFISEAYSQEQQANLDRPNREENIKDFDNFIISLYDNDNHILNHTFEAIKDTIFEHTPSSPSHKKTISKLVKDKRETIFEEAKSPAHFESLGGKLTALRTANFKPQHGTNIPTRRTYEYKSDIEPIELRFGTQGQRHQDTLRTSPLFERFLEIQQKRAKLTNPITHIYFNNLGLDRTSFALTQKLKLDAGTREKALTEALQDLEKTHKNVAVITLPADKGLMDTEDYAKINKVSGNKDEIIERFLEVAMGSSSHIPPSEKIKDFYISDTVSKLLFGEEDQLKEAKLKELIEKSFKTLRLPKKDRDGNPLPLTRPQQQAVWIHFIKYELTNFIITKLNPMTINFTCKDAIDRGGVSSAYYNLMKSFERNKPMTRDEFEQALHAAPTMVKGRGMNHHFLLLWNAIDAYVDANHRKLFSDPNKAWIIEWRNLNCPHKRVADVLHKAIRQCRIDLELEPTPRTIETEKKLEIIAKVRDEQYQGNTSRRLLLEAATRTAFFSNNKQEEARYDRLVNKLQASKSLYQKMKEFFARFSKHFKDNGLAQKMRNIKDELVSLRKDDSIPLEPSNSEASESLRDNKKNLSL